MGNFTNIVLFWSIKILKSVITSFWLVNTTNITVKECSILIVWYQKRDTNCLLNKAGFWLVDIKKDKNFLVSNAWFWLVDIRKDKHFLVSNDRFWLVDSKTFENSMVRLDEFYFS